jgi:hypothetical protein
MTIASDRRGGQAIGGNVKAKLPLTARTARIAVRAAVSGAALPAVAACAAGDWRFACLALAPAPRMVTAAIFPAAQIAALFSGGRAKLRAPSPGSHATARKAQIP